MSSDDARADGPTAVLDPTYDLVLGFMPGSHAIADPDRPPLLRAGPRAAGPYGDDRIERHRCKGTDLAQRPDAAIDLFETGFDVVDLGGLGDLQDVCARVRAAGRIADDDGAALRAAVAGAVLPCSSGRSLTVLHVADEGLIMRSAGPNRMAVVGPRSTGMNDHGPAISVHADQDVHGTPLVQLMDGRAPELFRHDSPDGANHDASLMLVNLWIPLQQITQPLVLGDGRSVDRLRHQLRFGLPTDTFLERDDDQVINDIWTFLHDPGQRWYFRSAMDHRHAYVFDTLSTPHGSAVLPGEDVAEACSRALAEAEAAAAAGDVTGVVDAVAAVDPVVPPGVTPALAAALAAMGALLAEAAADPAAIAGERASGWSARSRAARRQVVRMSVELRLVVSTAPV